MEHGVHVNPYRQYATQAELAVLDAHTHDPDMKKRVLDAIAARLSALPAPVGSNHHSDRDDETRRLHLRLQIEYAGGQCHGDGCGRYVLDSSGDRLEWHHSVATGGSFKRWISWVKGNSGEQAITAAVDEIQQTPCVLLCRQCHRRAHDSRYRPPTTPVSSKLHKRTLLLEAEHAAILNTAVLVTEKAKKRLQREVNRLSA